MNKPISRRSTCSRIVKSWTEKYTGRLIIKTADGSIWQPFDRIVCTDRVVFGQVKDGKVCVTDKAE